MLGCSLVLGLVVPLHGAQAAKETVLYSWTWGTDGSQPEAGLIRDKAGNLFGTTVVGGGTVFKLAPDGTERVLHAFIGGSDGAFPRAGLIRDSAGNLYGTTFYGGTICSGGGCGTVFELSPPAKGETAWTEKVIHYFKGGSIINRQADGSGPMAGLMMDSAGNLYGTTSAGGEVGGYGTVFKLAPPASGKTRWTETLLHTFKGYPSDGGVPQAGLIMDKAGNLYGTTTAGGPSPGLGTVFVLSPPPIGKTQWTEGWVHTFKGYGTDGAGPLAGLIMVGDMLYGTTFSGGPGCNNTCGTVFEVSRKTGAYSVLHFFTGGSDGEHPAGGLINVKGTLYGTTYSGGTGSCTNSGVNGCGTVFSINLATNVEKILYSFQQSVTDGQDPDAGLTKDSEGNLYGTTILGGQGGGGTVFKLTP